MSVVYDKPVKMVIAYTMEGEMGFLRDHATCSALLDDGALRIFEENGRNEDVLVVLGGILTVRDNEVTVLSEIAERPDKIQELLANLEAQRAASEIEEQNTELYTKRMEMAIRRALVHMDVEERVAHF